MFNNLQALGLGLVTFAITIGIGTVILIKFGDAVAVCPNYIFFFLISIERNIYIE
jgi:hypothetical protein